MKITTILLAGFLGIVAFVGIRYAIAYYDDLLIPPLVLPQQQPYIYLGDRDTVAVHDLHPGQSFFLRTPTKRVEKCGVTLEYSLDQISRHGELTIRKVFYNYPTIASTTIIGDGMTDRLMTIPSWLPPADYMLEREAYYSCRGQEIHIETPPIAVHVIAQ